MAEDVTAVKAAFSEFDGRRVAPIRALADADLSAAARVAVLAAVAGPDQIAATWIAKRWAERGALRSAEALEILAALPEMTEPDAILHTLQMVQVFPEEATPALPEFRKHVTHRRALVRTWALDAAVRCAPMAEAKALLSAGLTSPSAAMRARARQLQAAGYGAAGTPRPPKRA